MDAYALVAAYERLIDTGYIEPTTRRERIATAALQGLLASQVPGCTWGHERAAVESVEYADALIAALDASNESEG